MLFSLLCVEECVLSYSIGVTVYWLKYGSFPQFDVLFCCDLFFLTAPSIQEELAVCKLFYALWLLVLATARSTREMVQPADLFCLYVLLQYFQMHGTGSLLCCILRLFYCCVYRYIHVSMHYVAFLLTCLIYIIISSRWLSLIMYVWLAGHLFVLHGKKLTWNIINKLKLH